MHSLTPGVSSRFLLVAFPLHTLLSCQGACAHAHAPRLLVRCSSALSSDEKKTLPFTGSSPPPPPSRRKRPLERVTGTQIFCTRMNIWDAVSGVKLRGMEKILPFEKRPLLANVSFQFHPEFCATLPGISYEHTKDERQDKVASKHCEVVELLKTTSASLNRLEVFIFSIIDLIPSHAQAFHQNKLYTSHKITWQNSQSSERASKETPLEPATN